MSTVATLGPAGTDAETMARQLTQDVVLCDSFSAAMDHAITNGTQALIACGYKEIAGKRIVDTWVDLHFRSYGKVKIVNTYCRKTKPMCIAKRRGCENPGSIVIHPATESFVPLAPWKKNLEVSYVNAKPKAAEQAADGLFDSCIASCDVVKQYNNLEIVKVLEPQMVWALYERT